MSVYEVCEISNFKTLLFKIIKKRYDYMECNHRSNFRKEAYCNEYTYFKLP